MQKSMQPVLELGPIDKHYAFDVGLIQLSFRSSVFTQYMQHLSQIAPRVCTLVLFIIIVCQFLLLITSNDYNNIEAN